MSTRRTTRRRSGAGRTQRSPRAPGRPQEPAVTRDAVLEAALALLEVGGLAAVTMRGLAKKLGVDAMAPYHYFASKDDIVMAAAAWKYTQFRPRVRAGAWPARVVALGLSYARFLSGSRELVRALVSDRARSAAPAAAFARHFDAVVARAGLEPRLARTTHDAVVDLVHGAVLAGSDAGLRAELMLVVAGAEALRASSRIGTLLHAHPRHR